MAANQSIRILVANDAPITAYERCCVFDQLLGDDDRAFTKGVVLNGVLGTFALSTGTRSVTIAGGMASIDGRQFLSPSAVTFDLSALTGVKYCVVYVEVSTMSVANEFAKLCLAFDSGSFPTMDGDDIVRQERGVARMPLHRFIYSAVPGTIRDATQLFEGREPGTAFQTRHVRDEATIYGNDVDELIEESEPYFAKSRSADQTGDVPEISGKGIDGNLCVDDSLAALTVVALDTITLMPETCGGHEGGDGAAVTVPNEYGDPTAPSAFWQGGDKYEAEFTPSMWPEIQHANGYAEFVAWLVQIRLSATGWQMGFLGLGSHWEQLEYSPFVHNEIITGADFRGVAETARLRIKMSMYGSQPRLIADHGFSQTSSDITVTLPGRFPTTSAHGASNPTIKIEITGGNHWYGRIKLTPLIILDQVSRART